MPEQIKIEYKNEIKKIAKVTEYSKFVNLVLQRFDQLESQKGDVSNLKFTFVDQDQDVITISCNSDLAEAFEQVPPGQTLKVYIQLRKPTNSDVTQSEFESQTFAKPREEEKGNQLISSKGSN